MVQSKATAEVSGDGKSIICRSADGRVRWSKNAPSYDDWQRLAKRPVSVNLEAGIFQCVGGEHEGMIIAVFTPGRSLDFNLTYIAGTGELIKISEAR